MKVRVRPLELFGEVGGLVALDRIGSSDPLEPVVAVLLADKGGEAGVDPSLRGRVLLTAATRRVTAIARVGKRELPLGQ